VAKEKTPLIKVEASKKQLESG